MESVPIPMGPWLGGETLSLVGDVKINVNKLKTFKANLVFGQERNVTHIWYMPNFWKYVIIHPYKVSLQRIAAQVCVHYKGSNMHESFLQYFGRYTVLLSKTIEVYLKFAILFQLGNVAPDVWGLASTKSFKTSFNNTCTFQHSKMLLFSHRIAWTHKQRQYSSSHPCYLDM